MILTTTMHSTRDIISAAVDAETERWIFHFQMRDAAWSLGGYQARLIDMVILTDLQTVEMAYDEVCATCSEYLEKNEYTKSWMTWIPDDHGEENAYILFECVRKSLHQLLVMRRKFPAVVPVQKQKKQGFMRALKRVLSKFAI